MENKTPLVTIVTPSYNQGQFIEQTIQSVLSQTYKNIQYIVVDGGSTDCTMEVIEKYRDKIDIVIHEKDKGQSDAINKGFKLASGKLVGWLNSDDILYPDCVEKIVELYLNHSDGSIYYPSSLDYIDAAGNLLNTRIQKIRDKNYLLNINYSVIQQGSFYECEALKQVNYVDENIYYCMDLDLWLRLLSIGPIYYYNGKSLAAIRSWEGTKTAQSHELFLNDILGALNKYGAKRISVAKFYMFYIRCRIIGGKLKRLF
jgi:glycosyltransferase involved in cell wall biosynthesis